MLRPPDVKLTLMGSPSAGTKLTFGLMSMGLLFSVVKVKFMSPFMAMSFTGFCTLIGIDALSCCPVWLYSSFSVAFSAYRPAFFTTMALTSPLAVFTSTLGLLHVHASCLLVALSGKTFVTAFSRG